MTLNFLQYLLPAFHTWKEYFGSSEYGKLFFQTDRITCACEKKKNVHVWIDWMHASGNIEEIKDGSFQ